MVDPVDNRGCIAMVSGNRRDGQSRLFEHHLRYGVRADGRRDIVGMKGYRCGKVLQIGECAIRSKEKLEKATGGRKIRTLALLARTVRAPNIENNRARSGNGAGLEK